MAGSSGTSARSDKADKFMPGNGTKSPFVKEEFQVLLVKEEIMKRQEHAGPKENHEILKKQKHDFLLEKLEFESSEKLRLQKELRELEERYFELKRDTILLREENLNEKSLREEYEKLLEEMKQKGREDMEMISRMRDDIHELLLAKGRAQMEVEMWKSRLGELQEMVAEVAKDCLELRSMYQNEMSGGVSCDVGIGRPGNAGTGETNGILSVPRIENNTAELGEDFLSMEKHADVIEISDSKEDKNLRGDGRDRNRSKTLERDDTTLRISSYLNGDSVSSSKTRGGRRRRRRVSRLGIARPYSSSSSSTDTSSSESDAGDPNRNVLGRSNVDKLRFLKRP